VGAAVAVGEIVCVAVGLGVGVSVAARLGVEVGSGVCVAAVSEFSLKVSRILAAIVAERLFEARTNVGVGIGVGIRALL